MGGWHDLERIVDEFTVPNFVNWLTVYVRRNELYSLARRLSPDNSKRIRLAESNVNASVGDFRESFGADSAYLEPEHFCLLYVHQHISALAACDELIEHDVFLENVQRLVESSAPFEERLEQIDKYYESLYARWFGHSLEGFKKAIDRMRLELLERLDES